MPKTLFVKSAKEIPSSSSTFQQMGAPSSALSRLPCVNSPRTSELGNHLLQPAPRGLVAQAWGPGPDGPAARGAGAARPARAGAGVWAADLCIIGKGHKSRQTSPSPVDYI